MRKMWLHTWWCKYRVVAISKIKHWKRWTRLYNYYKFYKYLKKKKKHIEVLLKLNSAVISVFSFVMHYESVFDEIKTVRFRFKRMLYHFFNQFRTQIRELVNVFAGVFAVWYAKSEFEIERLQQFVTEIMAFDHAKLVHWLTSNSKLHCCSDQFQFKELGCKLIPYEPATI